MLRETTFWLGGILTMALGIALAVGLYFAGAGLEFFDAWAGSGIAVAFGAFFVYVGRDEHRHRLAFLAEAEEEPPGPPGEGPR
jgi:hypothetical protein